MSLCFGGYSMFEDMQVAWWNRKASAVYERLLRGTAFRGFVPDMQALPSSVRRARLA